MLIPQHYFTLWFKCYFCILGFMGEQTVGVSLWMSPTHPKLKVLREKMERSSHNIMKEEKMDAEASKLRQETLHHLCLHQQPRPKTSNEKLRTSSQPAIALPASVPPPQTQDFLATWEVSIKCFTVFLFCYRNTLGVWHTTGRFAVLGCSLHCTRGSKWLWLPCYTNV